MDVTQALKDAENTLRDFIAATLRKTFGDGWEEKCGVSADRIAKWKERKTIEAKRQEAGVVEERLLYYADFYDLKTMLQKHWQHFAPALGEWKTMEVWLTELEKLRDPDAHRRELLPHQQHLALGISGEIRTRIVRFRSKQATSDSYFPQIESVRDSLGNIWTLGFPGPQVFSHTILHPGDTVEYVVTASDPFGADLRYLVKSWPHQSASWQDNNILSLTVEETDIGKDVEVVLSIKSPRGYHARGEYDDFVIFYYTILPQPT